MGGAGATSEAALDCLTEQPPCAGDCFWPPAARSSVSFHAAQVGRPLYRAEISKPITASRPKETFGAAG